MSFWAGGVDLQADYAYYPCIGNYNAGMRTNSIHPYAQAAKGEKVWHFPQQRWT